MFKLVFYLLVGMGLFTAVVGCWPWLKGRLRERRLREARRRMRRH